MLPGCRNILLVADGHTRNKFYFSSLAALRDILLAAGYGVRIGSLVQTHTQDNIPITPESIVIEPIVRHGDYIEVKDFMPCLIFLNNDLSDGNYEILLNLKQPVKPPPQLGWHSRLKTQHFQYYDQVCSSFAKLIDCDPWLFNPLFAECNNVDFMRNQGMEELIATTGKLLQAIEHKYQQYDIKQQPFVIIKSNSGTYGMAVLTVKSVTDLQTLNRKQRKKMSHIKGDRTVSQVIVQEGVYTFEWYRPTTASDMHMHPAAPRSDSVLDYASSLDRQGIDSQSRGVATKSVAEPVIYMISRYVIGGFYRIHAERGVDENLNTPGMLFDSAPLAASCLSAYHEQEHTQHKDCFYSYGVVARLALLQ